MNLLGDDSFAEHLNSCHSSPKESILWPLAVHIIHHHNSPGYENVSAPTAMFAEKLIAGLSNGERSGKVPVRLWRGLHHDGEFQPPFLIPLENASRNVIVLLVDQDMFSERITWDRYISALLDRFSPERDLILPIASGADAAKLSIGLKDTNHITVEKPARLAENERVLQAVYNVVLTKLIGEAPRVFICHAKADGERIATKVRNYLENRTQLRCFFDLHDIPHGHGVKKSIETAIRESLLFVVWTDRLLDSPWCQYEIIEARRHQRPMLVLDALTIQTSRLFPFLGNMPVVTWRNKPAPIVSALLLELIRTFHLKSVFEHLKKSYVNYAPRFGLHPPDLLDSHLSKYNPITAKSDGLGPSPRLIEFIYPDPPLKLDELEILKQLVPNKRFLTLIEWHAMRAGDVLQAEWDVSRQVRPNPLHPLCVGISVSESENWADMGLIGKHQDDLAADIALELILLGGKMLWGGDLRPDGLGTRLRQIVQTYQHPTHPTQDYVAVYKPYSLRSKLSPREIKVRKAFADIRLMSCTVNLPRKEATKISSETPAGRALMALDLSAMRALTAHDSHARIVLGGRLRGFQGLYPGIVEEAFESIRANRPLFILGGFGGAAKAILEVISNPRTAETSELAHACRQFGAEEKKLIKEEHNRWVRLANRSDLHFHPQSVISTFSTLGWIGLSQRNGLSEGENEELSKSQDVYQILGLLVKGLSTISRKLNQQK